MPYDTVDPLGTRQVQWNERINKTKEKMHLGESLRLVVYSGYETKNNKKLVFYYAFSSDIRSTVVPYGSTQVTFRWLYALLSKKFCTTGSSFLDEYFSVQVYNRLASQVEEVYKAVGFRRNVRGRFISKEEQIRVLYNFEFLCKNDCIEWLKEGGVSYKLAEATVKKREYLGIAGKAAFYATGQLIEDMQLVVGVNEVQE